MPTIIIEGHKFRFYSSDGSEPPHMHVLRGENHAKIWLRPVAVEYNHGYSLRDLNHIVRLAHQHRARLLKVRYGYFGRQGP